MQKESQVQALACHLPALGVDAIAHLGAVDAAGSDASVSTVSTGATLLLIERFSRE